MNAAVLDQIPQGEELGRAIFELEEREQAKRFKTQIQHGLDVSSDPAAPRTAHADFMAELKAEIMGKINGR